MSSACVCHLNEWCFYCEVYLTVEKERDIWRSDYGKAQQEIAELEDVFAKQDKEIDHYKDRARRAENLLEDIMHGSPETLILWIEYDQNSREIESHVNHLITNGHRVLIAQHASVVGTGQYSWMINNTLIDWVTHYAKINLPTKNIKLHGGGDAS